MNRLYIEAKQIKVTKEREATQYFKEVCPFKPKVTDTTEPKLENFYKRLQIWIEQRNEASLRSYEMSKMDEKTGLPLFTPNAGKVDSNRERLERNIHYELYNDRKRKEFKQNESENMAIEELRRKANLKFASDQTNGLNEKLKEECFDNLFRALDHDGDNIISASEEFLKNLQDKIDEGIQELIEPLLEELKENNESLTKEEFLLAIAQLFNVLNVDQKRRILNWYTAIKRQNSPRKNNSSVNFSFQPVISENSSHLYQSSQRYSKDFLERNLIFLENKDNYFKHKQEEKLEEEIRGKYIILF